MRNIILVIVLSLCSFASHGQLDEFLIGYYSQDYNNKDYVPSGTSQAIGNDFALLQLIKDFGANYVHINYQLFSPSEQYAANSPSIYFLDNASDLGLRVILRCPDIYVKSNNPPYNPTTSIQGLNYYGNHPSIIGFDLRDEPNSAAFPIINSYANDIRNFNGNFLRLSNLFPNYASNESLFGTTGTPTYDDYSRYVQDYIDATNPNIISFDHYPIWQNQNNFFTNLDVFAKKSRLNNIPFIYVLTQIRSTASLPYCYQTSVPKNIPEFNYVIFASLAYGAKGISYWHSTCKNDFFGVIPPDVMTHLENLHTKLKKSSKTLLKLTFQSAYHKSDNSTILPGQIEQIHASSLWSLFSNDQFAKEIFNVGNPIQPLSGSTINNIVISFLTDDSNNRYFWIFNKSISEGESIQMNFKESTALIDILDNTLYEKSLNKTVYLEAGEAKLYKINKTYQSSISLCNSTFYSGNYADVWAEALTLGGPSCNIAYMSGAKIIYSANNIFLKQGVKINRGSNVSFHSVTISNLKSATISKIDTQDLIVYPNPNSGQFTISLTNENGKIFSYELYDLAGEKLFGMNGLDIDKIEFSYRLTSGTYILKVTSNQGCDAKKIIVY